MEPQQPENQPENSIQSFIAPEFKTNPTEEQKKEYRLIERLLELNLGLTLVFGGLLFTLAFFVVIWKFNTGDKTPTPAPVATQAEQHPTVLPRPKIADADVKPVFIADQVIELENAFSGPPSKTKVTVNGQLKKEVFGFLPYWAIDKLDELNIKMFTEVSYFGLEVDGNGDFVKVDTDGSPYTPWAYWQSDPKLEAFLKNARKNRVKTTVTLKNFSNTNIEKLVKSNEASQNFIRNALYLVNSRSLDGLNLDFEYVGTPDQKVVDGFSILVSKLNKELKRQYPKSVLTISTYVSAGSRQTIHDVQVLAQNCDGLVIMGYDFHTPQSSITGPLAPMEGYGNSMTGLMSSYLEKVAPEKLILAVGYYGYDWPVNSPEQNAEVVGKLSDVRIRSYADIMEATQKTKISWDERGQSPWFTYVDAQTGLKRVVHFENARSLGVKYDYINQKNLKGVGIWALGFDGRNTDLGQLIVDKFAE